MTRSETSTPHAYAGAPFEGALSAQAELSLPQQSAARSRDDSGPASPGEDLPQELAKPLDAERRESGRSRGIARRGRGRVECGFFTLGTDSASPTWGRTRQAAPAEALAGPRLPRSGTIAAHSLMNRTCVWIPRRRGRRARPRKLWIAGKGHAPYRTARASGPEGEIPRTDREASDAEETSRRIPRHKIQYRGR